MGSAETNLLLAVGILGAVAYLWWRERRVAWLAFLALAVVTVITASPRAIPEVAAHSEAVGVLVALGRGVVLALVVYHLLRRKHRTHTWE